MNPVPYLLCSSSTVQVSTPTTRDLSSLSYNNRLPPNRVSPPSRIICCKQSQLSKMSGENVPPSPPRPQHRRRSSFVDMFTPRSHSSAPAISSSPPSATVPSTPSVPQHRRGTSITALGLTTNPAGQSAPFAAFQRQRRASIATSSTSSSPDFKNSFGDEPAVVEEDDASPAALNPPSPSFARRVSFGAQALRDVRLGASPGTSGGGRRPSSSLFTLDENFENAIPSRQATSGTAKTAGKSRGQSFPSSLSSLDLSACYLLPRSALLTVY